MSKIINILVLIVYLHAQFIGPHLILNTVLKSILFMKYISECSVHDAFSGIN
jgi:hypothetical protein